MSRPRKNVPSYVPHHNGQARMVWRDAAGNRRFKTLPGPFNSEESLAAFHRLCLEITTSSAPKLRAVDSGPTVAEVLLPYLKHAAEYYGEGSSEMYMVKDALRPVRELYGLIPAAEFGPLALAAVRETYVRKGWSRGYVNRIVAKVVRAFKWAASREVVPTSLHAALKTLPPLKAGRTTAPETTPRTAANPEHVAKTLPFLPPHTRAIVELLRLTGARPSEVCRMTLDQIDRSGAVWVYSPKRHKNSHRRKGRTVLLGPAAQAVIVAHLGGKVLGPDESLFSPRRQREERHARMRAVRKTPVQPSQASRKKANPMRAPGEWFVASVVLNATLKACKKAGVPEWTPYMLRHLVAAEVRAGFGIEHAKALLGHAGTGMTDHYAKGADRKLAEEVASKAG